MGTSPLEPGRVVAGRYRIESEIGKGGMGVVYLVRHVHTDESLALKILHTHVLREEQAVERFKREARAPARIASEHVARVTDADTASDVEGAPFYVVMELLRGKDLEHLLAERGPLPPEVVAEYLRQAARALDKAHALGIVHRDLKPENLFLTHREDGSPCVKLLDFGIARLADLEAPGQSQTQAGFVFGTPSFMAPEQAMGSVDFIGPQTDVWALGLVAFKLLVGSDFWQAQAVAHLYAKILSEPIPTPTERGSTYGPAFDAWFARCVNRNIQLRFASAGEAAAELAAALGVRVGNRSSASLVASGELASDAAHAARASHASVPSSSFRAAGAVAAQPAAAIVTEHSGVASEPPTAATRRPALVLGLALGGLVIVLGGLGIGYGLSRKKPWGLVARASSPSAESAVPTSLTSATAATTTVTNGAPSASVASASSEAAPAEAPAAKVADGPRPRGAKAAAPAKAPDAPAPREPVLSRDQRRRLESLQRLCDQGTFSAAECKDKRQAILREAN